MEEPVRVFIERAKAALSIETDEQLASELGYSKQTIANWRRRGAVPEKAQERIAQIAGPEFVHNEWRQMSLERREKTILYALLANVFSRLLEGYGTKLTPENLAKLGMAFSDLETGLLGHIRDIAFYGKPEAEIIRRLLDRLDDDRMIEVAWFFIEVRKHLRDPVDQ